MTGKSLALVEVLKLRSTVLGVQAFWIGTFALLTAIGAQIEIPHQPVPYTLQTFFVLLAGALLGARRGFMSMSLYLLVGLLGLPVFSGAGFGLARILGPTGGYLLAFPLAALVIGFITNRRGSFVWIVTGMLAGLMLIFTLGTLQLKLVSGMDWGSAIQSGFLIFSWWDVLKLSAAATIAHQFLKRTP
ncbi:MAG TPA: biotin transporter BioY [Bacteroidota bacterium]|nr:biotin transporter BioY [Bacteroidota bacterium]